LAFFIEVVLSVCVAVPVSAFVWRIGRQLTIVEPKFHFGEQKRRSAMLESTKSAKVVVTCGASVIKEMR
jgi:hypothetical protein